MVGVSFAVVEFRLRTLLGMSDTQLLRDILSELKKVNSKLSSIDSGVASVETAVYNSAPSD
jgi:hypothetical protein